MDVSLISPVVSRNGLPFSDSFILNGYVQSNKFVSKRPGINTQYQFMAGQGQGMFTLNGLSYGVIDDVINLVTAPYTTYSIPGISTTNLQYQFITNPPYLATPLLVLKSTAGMWTFDGATVTRVTDGNYPVLTIPGVAFLDGTYYVQTPAGEIFGSNIADPTTWTALNVLTVNSLQGQSVAICSNNVQVASFGSQWLTQYFDYKNPPPGSPLAQNFSGSHSTGCASAESIVQMADFVVFMAQTDDGRSICMLNNADITKISDDNINRILNNDNLSVVYAFSLSIGGTLFYLISLGSTGITLVYDFTAGLWTYWASGELGGSIPVSLTLSTDGETVTGIANNHGFLSGDAVAISGATLTPFNGSFSIYVIDANTFTYVLNYQGQVVDQNGNFVVDQNGNFWVANVSPPSGTVAGATIVNQFQTTYLSIIASTGANYCLDVSDGRVYTLSVTDYDDADGLIDFQIVTPEIEGNDSDLKRMGAIEVRGDKVETTGYIRYSDDGYNTWSIYQPVDMMNTRSQTVRCGSTRRRAIQFRNIDTTPLRVKDWVLDIDWTG